MIRRPPRSTLFPTRRSSDLGRGGRAGRPCGAPPLADDRPRGVADRKSTRLNSSHVEISYAVFCLKKKKYKQDFSISRLEQLRDGSAYPYATHSHRRSAGTVR